MRRKYAIIVVAAGALALSVPLLAQGGGGRGRGAAGASGRRAGARTSGFPQYTRPLAPQDVLARGKSLYEANCASCHASDLRGVLDKHGPNLLRSTQVFSDKEGELVAASVKNHKPVINLPTTDTYAIAEYLHSVQATMGAQGSPPGRNPVGLTYNVLIGDVKDGQAAFGRLCASCHSVTGDLKGIATKYPDPKTLQNTWVAGGGGGRGRGARNALEGTVTLPDGQKYEGRIARRDDFLVVLILADGTRKSFAIEDGVPKV
jgi:cytochrome c oxidase cbb3-type subunit 3